MHKIQNAFKIVSNEQICPSYYRLCLDAKPILKAIRPGQFVHIKVSDSLVPFFRRPFSVYRAQKYVEIFYEIVGKGTEILASKKSSDQLDVLGPLGNSFSMPSPSVKQVVMIAGGVGVAPFMILSDCLARKRVECILLYGARTKKHIFDMTEFKKNRCKVFISTDDGSVGKQGQVSKLFSKIKKNSRSTALYTCGPKPMMAAVQKFAEKHGLHCETSLEEVMACGLGACLGCSIKTTQGYKTVCHDGPVFDINEIEF